MPFDLEHWQRVAAERYPDGLPEPFSSDPSQWLFTGLVPGSDDPLQVAVARLLGYRWPEQAADGLDDLVDPDGIVCLPAVRMERPAADRLLDLLARAYGPAAWSPAQLDALLAGAGVPGGSLERWLRDHFFPQHLARFHNRPFLWQIWDGRKDGFSAIVNYHRLDRATLDKLIYSYLGDWIARQRQATDPQAEARLLAALELETKLVAIATGEPPHDIFVRWKPLAQQPLGWEPDLNDGVRLNIRPFVLAGVLRSKFSINWNKDRGTNPAGAPWGPERHNDKHLTIAEKPAARAAAKDTTA